MRLRTVPTLLAAALAAALSISAAQAGMSNISVSPGVGTRVTPNIPDVTARPHMIDAKIKLNCYHTRELNEFGVWVHRTHCN
jgi:hypothetical protein